MYEGFALPGGLPKCSVWLSELEDRRLQMIGIPSVTPRNRAVDFVLKDVHQSEAESLLFGLLVYSLVVSFCLVVCLIIFLFPRVCGRLIGSIGQL